MDVEAASNGRTENMIVSVPNIVVIFEIEDVVHKKPVIAIKMGAEGKLKNWSSSLEMKGTRVLELFRDATRKNVIIESYSTILQETLHYNARILIIK